MELSWWRRPGLGSLTRIRPSGDWARVTFESFSPVPGSGAKMAGGLGLLSPHVAVMPAWAPSGGGWIPRARATREPRRKSPALLHPGLDCSSSLLSRSRGEAARGRPPSRGREAVSISQRVTRLGGRLWSTTRGPSCARKQECSSMIFILSHRLSEDSTQESSMSRNVAVAGSMRQNRSCARGSGDGHSGKPNPRLNTHHHPHKANVQRLGFCPVYLMLRLRRNSFQLS